ncbi:hypothetical protein ACWCOX_06725, partial [Micromonospora parva]
MGTDMPPVPVTGWAAKVSPMARIAPPPVGRLIAGPPSPGPAAPRPAGGTPMPAASAVGPPGANAPPA